MQKVFPLAVVNWRRVLLHPHNHIYTHTYQSNVLRACMLRLPRVRDQYSVVNAPESWDCNKKKETTELATSMLFFLLCAKSCANEQFEVRAVRCGAIDFDTAEMPSNFRHLFFHFILFYSVLFGFCSSSSSFFIPSAGFSVRRIRRTFFSIHD